MEALCHAHGSSRYSLWSHRVPRLSASWIPRCPSCGSFPTSSVLGSALVISGFANFFDLVIIRFVWTFLRLRGKHFLCHYRSIVLRHRTKRVPRHIPSAPIRMPCRHFRGQEVWAHFLANGCLFSLFLSLWWIIVEGFVHVMGWLVPRRCRGCLGRRGARWRFACGAGVRNGVGTYEVYREICFGICGDVDSFNSL